MEQDTNKFTPKSIKKLDEAVVNRIAAGEVIHRPANAVKELLENCLDAGSTSIKIITAGGGIKLLQVQDNGHGIKKEDLDIVCERFTTSKITKYEDLQQISTFGFRGEALASISHIAHLTVISMTASQKCAYKASYSDGKLTATLPNQSAAPKPIAGTVGTTIIVEDFFYNVLARRKALKSPAEEYQKIIEVVMRYAVHNEGVGFTCKKQGNSTADVCTQSSSTTVDNIRTLYGDTISRELLQVQLDHKQDKLQFVLKGYVTNPNYNVKSGTFILFINNRLVDSSALKKAVDSVYSNYLPKGTHPFVYLSITVPPQNVDVNVHPTKQEVHLLHEVEIIEQVQRAINERLLESNSSRNFSTQPLLHINDQPLVAPQVQSLVKGSVLDHVAQNKKVRTDPKARTLNSMLASKSTSQSQAPHERQRLTSIQQLIDDVHRNTHDGLQDLFKNCSFVGAVDGTLAAVQHRTKLYLINMQSVSKELMYQQALLRFAEFAAIQLANPLSVHELLTIALESPESGWTETDGPKEQIARFLCEGVLFPRADMLKEYFSIEIDSDGNLCALPQIIDNYIPDMTLLPSFLLRISTEVAWEEEKPCFEMLCRELSEFYSIQPDVVESQMDIVQQIFSPLYSFKPPKSLSTDGSLIQIASLEALYKVFERC